MLYDPKWEVPVTLEPWRRVLLDAADLLQRDGFCQSKAYEDGRRCALGAIMKAQDRYIAGPRAGTPEYDAVQRLTNALGSKIAKWNDAPGRTAEEVIAKMREVATQ